MAGNGESRRKEDASLLVLFLIILFMKLSSSTADVPGLRNICVLKKNVVEGRQVQDVRETQFCSESWLVIKSGVSYKYNSVDGPIPEIKASPSRLNFVYEVDNLGRKY